MMSPLLYPLSYRPVSRPIRLDARPRRSILRRRSSRRRPQRDGALTDPDIQGILQFVKFDDELRAILEEAERRKETQLKSTGRKITMIIGIPLALLGVWAGLVLLQHRNGAGTRSAGSEPSDAPAPLAAETPDPEVSAFLPKAGGGDRGIVDKADIEFAMELLNYVRPPSSQNESKPTQQPSPVETVLRQMAR